MESILYNDTIMSEQISKLSKCIKNKSLISLANELEALELLSTGKSAEEVAEINDCTIQILKNMDLLVEKTIGYLEYIADVFKETDSKLSETITNALEVQSPIKDFVQ